MNVTLSNERKDFVIPHKSACIISHFFQHTQILGPVTSEGSWFLEYTWSNTARWQDTKQLLKLIINPIKTKKNHRKKKNNYKETLNSQNTHKENDTKVSRIYFFKKENSFCSFCSFPLPEKLKQIVIYCPVFVLLSQTWMCDSYTVQPS